MMDTVAFLATVVVILLPAVQVVRSRDLVQAVFWLALTLLGTAILFGLLGAPFLAGVQVLTYVGGVVTLVIFGVMVTRRHDSASAPAGNASRWRGAAGALALFMVLGEAVRATPLSSPGDPGPAGDPVVVATLARALLDEHLVAFEVASLLLLGAIVGAVVLARRRDTVAGGGAS